ncbi:kelch repeat-containing protein [Paenibacillus alba]|uniref:Kelch repeat-containing protein n=1 Tax=Paenibacillus alba TaxID=1197127 RepID=A0ABU6GEQ1_9BACL|nr:kelch repeat-containing protein [Paenibacillus alba]MEC0232687.1 kelch repeat-containing protein [Paenibacillus alba]
MKRFNALLFLMLIFTLLMSNMAMAETPSNDNWVLQKEMPNPRTGAAIAQVNGLIYSIGGANGSTVYSDLQVYNPTTNTWALKTKMPTARGSVSTAVVNNKIYVMGGYMGNL